MYEQCIHILVCIDAHTPEEVHMQKSVRQLSRGPQKQTLPCHCSRDDPGKMGSTQGKAGPQLPRTWTTHDTLPMVATALQNITNNVM